MKNINLTSNFHKCIHCQEIDFITLNTSCIKCGNSNNIVEFEDLEKTPYFCEDCNILFGKCECLHMDSGFDCMEDVHYAIIISIWKYKGVIYEGMPSFQNIQECRDLLEEIDLLEFQCGCTITKCATCSEDKDEGYKIDKCYCQEAKTYPEIIEEIDCLKQEEWWDKLEKFVLLEDNRDILLEIKLEIPYRYQDLVYNSKKNTHKIVCKNDIDSTEWFLEKDIWDFICVYSYTLNSIEEEDGSGGFIPRYYYDMKTAITNCQVKVIPKNKTNLEKILKTKKDDIYWSIELLIGYNIRNMKITDINSTYYKKINYTLLEHSDIVKKMFRHLQKFSNI
jgi:hypothetical protein